MAPEPSAELIDSYFKALARKDAAALRPCFGDRMDFDGGGGRRIHDPQKFVELCCAGPIWSEFELLDRILRDDQAALVYELREAKSGQRLRVAEFLTLRGGRIYQIRSTFGALPGATRSAEAEYQPDPDFGFRSYTAK